MRGMRADQRLIPAMTAGTTVSSAKAGRMQPTSGKHRRTGTVRARASARRRRSARSSHARRAERRRRRRSETRARAQRLGQAARARCAPAHLPQRIVERLAQRTRAHDRVELARHERGRPPRAEPHREIRRVAGAHPDSHEIDRDSYLAGELVVEAAVAPQPGRGAQNPTERPGRRDAEEPEGCRPNHSDDPAGRP